MTFTKGAIKKFFRESNLIEGMKDEKALSQSLFAFEQAMLLDEITPADINRIHGTLSHGYLLPRESGQFRTQMVWVGDRTGASHHALPNLVADWCQKYGDARKVTSVVRAVDAHVAYEHIHPHIDFNGRTGRLLFLWHLAKANMPILTWTNKGKFDSYYPLFATREKI